MTGGAVRLAGKELRDIVRERTIVLALVTQLFVAAFSAFLAVGLVALYDPGSLGHAPSSTVAYVGPGGFDEALAEQESFEVVDMELAEGLAAFRNHDISAVVSESYDDANGTRQVTLLLPEGELETTLLVTELKKALTDYERELREDRAERLSTPVIYAETDAGPTVSFTLAYSVLLPLLVATPVFLSGAITADSLSDEINEGTLLLLRAGPISAYELVLGKLLTPVLLVPAQVLLWVGLLTLNGLPVAELGLLLVAATAMGVLLSAGGLLVASLARREGPTQALYTLAVLALSLASLFMPQDPANLIARLGVGTADGASLATIGPLVGIAAAVLAATVRVVGQRLRADTL